MDKKKMKGPCNPGFWTRMASRLADDRACLSAFIAFHAAEVLAGVKPGNLVTIHDKVHPCGRNLLRLWRRYGAGLLQNSPLAAEELRHGTGSVLIYLYRPDLLETLLCSGRVRNFLRRAGYAPFGDSRDALDSLGRRFEQEDFPHEIGIFLGYPLKDVAGFMGWAAIPFSSPGPWKIYGRPDRSLELAACHRACRRRMAQELENGNDPARCLMESRLSWESLPQPWAASA